MKMITQILSYSTYARRFDRRNEGSEYDTSWRRNSVETGHSCCQGDSVAPAEPRGILVMIVIDGPLADHYFLVPDRENGATPSGWGERLVIKMGL